MFPKNLVEGVKLGAKPWKFLFRGGFPQKGKSLLGYVLKAFWSHMSATLIFEWPTWGPWSASKYFGTNCVNSFHQRYSKSRLYYASWSLVFALCSSYSFPPLPVPQYTISYCAALNTAGCHFHNWTMFEHMRVCKHSNLVTDLCMLLNISLYKYHLE